MPGTFTYTFLNFFTYRVCNSSHLGGGVTFADYEPVSYGFFKLTQVKDYNILAFLFEDAKNDGFIERGSRDDGRLFQDGLISFVQSTEFFCIRFGLQRA